MDYRNNGTKKGGRRERSEPPGDMTMSLSEQAVKPGRWSIEIMGLKDEEEGKGVNHPEI